MAEAIAKIRDGLPAEDLHWLDEVGEAMEMARTAHAEHLDRIAARMQVIKNEHGAAWEQAFRLVLED